jgi:hypothetical protein
MIRTFALVCAAAVGLTPIPAQADIWSIINTVAELIRILDGKTAYGTKGKNWIKVLPNGNVLVHSNSPGAHGTKVFHNGKLCPTGKGGKSARTNKVNKGKNKPKDKTANTVYSGGNCAILQQAGNGRIRLIEGLGKGPHIDFSVK